MKVKNENEETNFTLQCIMCKCDKKVVLVAHRNESRNIVGFVVLCRKCLKTMDNKVINIVNRK